VSGQRKAPVQGASSSESSEQDVIWAYRDEEDAELYEDVPIKHVDLTDDIDRARRYGNLYPRVNVRPFDDNQHRTIIAGRALLWLCATISFIVIATFISYWTGMPTENIDRIIFGSIALISIIASPLMHFFFRTLR
jgi:hypothetical protein